MNWIKLNWIGISPTCMSNDATKNLLNMQVVRSGMIYLIIYRMHHQWRHLNMPIRNLILNTATLTDGSKKITNEIFYIILMCMNDLFLSFTQGDSFGSNTRDSIRWLYSCNKSSYIRSVYKQCMWSYWNVLDKM